MSARSDSVATVGDFRPTPLLRFELAELSDADEPSFDFRAAFGGTHVAHARAVLLGDTLFLEHITVDEMHRARGIGTEMLRQLERVAAARGLRFLRCCLWRGRDAGELATATAWLRRQGFWVTLADGDVVHCIADVELH